MKRYLFLFLLVLFFPVRGDCQIPENNAGAWKNILPVDINLAFGPNSTATWDPSIGFRFQVSEHFRVGIGDVSFGAADLISGTRYAIMGGPVVEFVAPITNDISYSILAGVPLQTRWGAAIAHTFGAAPYGAASLDYHFSPVFALAGDFRLQYVATEAYLRSPRVLPSNAFLIAFGLGFHFYL